jgi:hypothetical protein
VTDAGPGRAVKNSGMAFIIRTEKASHDLWRLVLSRGLCARGGLDPDRWYPVSVTAAAARCEAADAIAICAACPVRRPCLELSLRCWSVGQHGIWGGTVPAEREVLRRAALSAERPL